MYVRILSLLQNYNGVATIRMVNIKRRIFKGDCLSQLMIVMDMIPLTVILRKKPDTILEERLLSISCIRKKYTERMNLKLTNLARFKENLGTSTILGTRRGKSFRRGGGGGWRIEEEIRTLEEGVLEY